MHHDHPQRHRHPAPCRHGHDQEEGGRMGRGAAHPPCACRSSAIDRFACITYSFACTHHREGEPFSPLGSVCCFWSTAICLFVQRHMCVVSELVLLPPSPPPPSPPPLLSPHPPAACPPLLCVIVGILTPPSASRLPCHLPGPTQPPTLRPVPSHPSIYPLLQDLRRCRSGMLNLAPTSTGSATAIATIFPELKGKLNGLAIRVPMLNASITDCVFEVHMRISV